MVLSSYIKMLRKGKVETAHRSVNPRTARVSRDGQEEAQRIMEIAIIH